jgi:hypothetical protein
MCEVAELLDIFDIMVVHIYKITRLADYMTIRDHTCYRAILSRARQEQTT